jgi:mRNA interferase MazF
MIIKKYDIILVNLNPTKGSEQKGIRPCMVLQNNGANLYSSTTVVCPLSSTVRRFPHTIILSPSKTNGLKNESRLDILQIRTIDKERIMKKMGVLDIDYKIELRQKIKTSFDLDDILE